MTEITRMILYPKKHRQLHALDPVALFVALIGGPLIVALLFFWVALIPVGAMIFGGPIYVLIGLPVSLIYFHSRPVTPADFSLLAGVTALIGAVLQTILDPFNGGLGGVGMAAFATVFAAWWGLFSGKIYIRLCRAPYFSSIHPKGEAPC